MIIALWGEKRVTERLILICKEVTVVIQISTRVPTYIIYRRASSFQKYLHNIKHISYYNFHLVFFIFTICSKQLVIEINAKDTSSMRHVPTHELVEFILITLLLNDLLPIILYYIPPSSQHQIRSSGNKMCVMKMCTIWVCIVCTIEFE